MGTRGVRCPEREGLLRGNQFHRCEHTAVDVVAAGRSLALMLAEAGDKGVAERPLLEWLGASTARIALLAHAGGQLVPTYVARELSLGDMRADFALLQVPKSSTAAPRLLLVECQGALPNSLFEKGKRKLLYWGHDFLDGFSQLVDWHFVGHHTTLNQAIATLTAGHLRCIEVSFQLVVGLQKFSMDELSQRRIISWAQTLTIGSNFRVSRFDDVAHEALSWTDACAELAEARDSVGEGRRSARQVAGMDPPRRAVMTATNNNKAALAAAS